MSDTVRFTMYGASDDLIETDGVPGCDEFNVNPKGKLGFAGLFMLSGPGGSMRIFAFYGPRGVWFFAPAQVDDGVALPDWSMRIHSGEPARGYSTVLEIDVPPGTVLVREAAPTD